MTESGHGSSSVATAVMVEVRVPPGLSAAEVIDLVAAAELPGFQIASDRAPVSMPQADAHSFASEQTCIVFGRALNHQLTALREHPGVVSVTVDNPIASFDAL